MSAPIAPLLVGEIFVDFTVTPADLENKLRLGGVAHAARGFWALDVPFRAAVVLPEYLSNISEDYFRSLGCTEFQVIGTVKGAPNVTVIFDATEVAEQGYESLLRDEKTVEISDGGYLASCSGDVLIFPGSFDLKEISSLLPIDAKLHIDVAYDISTPSDVAKLRQQMETVLISTSSDLFRLINPESAVDLFEAFSESDPKTVILKENRGGARLICAADRKAEELPAQLGATVNSVGVGDVFAAAYVFHLSKGSHEAGLRATYVSAAYSQTTCPDVFRRYVQRDLKLSFEELIALHGVFLPWEARPKLEIYLAAPDFSTGDRRAIDQALASLSYHNFRVRRPVKENGELPPNSDPSTLRRTYDADCSLLRECALVFAVPTQRDPGTLVEIGLAIEANIPVVTFDAAGENANTMVISGSSFYSRDLDLCLNAVFKILSERRKSP